MYQRVEKNVTLISIIIIFNISGSRAPAQPHFIDNSVYSSWCLDKKIVGGNFHVHTKFSLNYSCLHNIHCWSYHSDTHKVIIAYSAGSFPYFFHCPLPCWQLLQLFQWFSVFLCIVLQYIVAFIVFSKCACPDAVDSDSTILQSSVLWLRFRNDKILCIVCQQFTGAQYP